MTRSNYDLKEMANLFKNMGKATGEIQRELSYLSTHPMYENRISHIQNKSKLQNKPIINSTKDFYYIKAILEVESTSDINNSLKKLSRDSLLNLYKRSLLYFKKSDYKNVEREIVPIYNSNPNNLYIAILYAQTLTEQNNLDEALVVLNKIKNIYPHNSIISFTIAEILIENNINLNYAEKLMIKHEKNYKLNPNFLRLISKLYTLQNNMYKSSVFLSDYYVLLNNIDLAIEVLNNTIRSSKINNTQKKILLTKKERIICENPRRLQPLYGEKDCY